MHVVKLHSRTNWGSEPRRFQSQHVAKLLFIKITSLLYIMWANSKEFPTPPRGSLTIECVTLYYWEQKITTVLNRNTSPPTDACLFSTTEKVYEWILNHDAFFRRNMPISWSENAQLYSRLSVRVVSKYATAAPQRQLSRLKKSYFQVAQSYAHYFTKL